MTQQIHKVNELNTGQLAIVYQKLSKSIRKTAGGCWEIKNNSSRPANSHLTYIKSTKTATGYLSDVVYTMYAVRHQRGYTVDESVVYERTCNNPKCVNPAHQTNPYPRHGLLGAPTRITPDQINQAKRMYVAGWSSYHITSGTTYSAYMKALRSGTERVAPPHLVTTIEMDVLLKIARLYEEGKPSFAKIMAATGMTVDQLLPYGYAESAISKRSGSPENAEKTVAILTAIKNGDISSKIAADFNEPVGHIYTFKGALYG